MRRAALGVVGAGAVLLRCPQDEARVAKVQGLGFRVWGLGFRVWGLGFRV